MHHIGKEDMQFQQIRSKIVKQPRPVRKSPNAFLWIAVVTAVLLVGFYLFDGNTSKAEKGPMPTLPPNEVAGTAPAFTLTDLSGKQVSPALPLPG